MTWRLVAVTQDRQTCRLAPPADRSDWSEVAVGLPRSRARLWVRAKVRENARLAAVLALSRCARSAAVATH